MPAGEVTRESVCPTLPSFLHGDRGRPPTSDGASDAVSGFWTLSAGVGAPPPSPLWPTLRACSHFCRASSKSSMPENTRGRREGGSQSHPRGDEAQQEAKARAGPELGRAVQPGRDFLQAGQYPGLLQAGLSSDQKGPQRSDGGRGGGAGTEEVTCPAQTPRGPFPPPHCHPPQALG